MEKSLILQSSVFPIIDKTGTIIGASTIARNIPSNSYEQGFQGTGMQYRTPVEHVHLGDPDARISAELHGIPRDISLTGEDHDIGETCKECVPIRE